jgi:hypothetical protein
MISIIELPGSDGRAQTRKDEKWAEYALPPGGRDVLTIPELQLPLLGLEPPLTGDFWWYRTGCLSHGPALPRYREGRFGCFRGNAAFDENHGLASRFRVFE